MMKRIFIAIIVIGGLSSAVWLTRGAVPATVASRPQEVGQAVSFQAVDVFLDSGTTPLAAYQLEISAKLVGGKASLVGLEGGEAPAFRDAPYYDPALLRGEAGGAGGQRGGERIVVASFSTAENLPTGLTRVARLHFQLSGVSGGAGAGELEKNFEKKLVVATDARGQSIDAAISIRPFQGEAR